MGNCFSNSNENKNKKRRIDITENIDDEYKYSNPNKLSTIIEERTMDINITTDKI